MFERLSDPVFFDPKGVNGSVYSRKGIPKKQTLSSNGFWQIALYIRLSREDGNDESLSVANQRKILREFIQNQFEGEYRLVGEYVDDGVTGTDWERPAFQTLVEDIEAGAINCVICKNLARAFRNYSHQGYFLESFFPRHGTRFITLDGPSIDSFLRPEVVQGYEVPLSGIMNDRYAGRTSLDVRRTLDMKRRKGEFIGAFAPYGYRKDPENKNRLLADPEAARVVRDIYGWFVNGSSKGEIVRRLNELGIENPASYKRRNGLHYCNPNRERSDGMWSLRTVSVILSNEVYTGTMVQGRQRVISYKVHDCVSVPKEEWFVVEGTHEPIIDRETFQLVQKLSRRKTRTPHGTGTVHPLAGLVFCGVCGKAMHRTRARETGYFCCRTYQEKSRRACQKHTIRVDVLERIVLEAVQGQIARLEEIDSIGEAVRRKKAYAARQERSNCGLVRARKELARIHRRLDELYLDWKDGELNREDYTRRKKRLEDQAECLGNRIRGLEAEETKGEEGAPEGLSEFLRRGNIVALDRGLAVTLLHQIRIWEGKIEIQFVFSEHGSEQQGEIKNRT